MHVHRLLLCFAVAACSADTGEPVRITGAYQRPALDTLLAPARQSERGPYLAGEVRASIQALAGTDVHRAVWATVDAMGKAGLEELYGFESFGDQGACAYTAMFFVNTGSELLCLLAEGALHEGRTSKTTLPYQPVTQADFDLLRARIDAELPFKNEGAFVSRVEDGRAFWLHVYRDGQSQSALCYEPGYQPWPIEDGDREAFAQQFRFTALLGALQAAVPATFCPDLDVEGWEEKYARLKGWGPR